MRRIALSLDPLSKTGIGLLFVLRTYHIYFLLALTALTSAMAVSAQNYGALAPRSAGTQVNQSESKSSGLPAKEASSKNEVGASTEDSRQVVASLKSLTFLADAKDLEAAGVNSKGIVVSGLGILEDEEFSEHMAAYLNKPLSFSGLNNITTNVVNFYRAHNRPLVNVFVPEQDVQSGSIQVVVEEYRVGEVRAKGNRWFSSRVVTSPITLAHGDIVDTERLLGQLDAANANPFRHVNLIYEPSRQPGYTDLVLQTADRFPLRVYSGYDNSGQASTGRTRWNMGLNWGNTLWMDGQLSYQFTSSSDFWTGRSSAPNEPKSAGFASHSLNWSMPVFHNDSISVFGVYAQSTPNIGSSLGAVGLSGQASIRYVKSLPRRNAFVQTLQFGYDFKTTNNNLDFGGVSISANSSEVDQFPVGYTGTRTDRYGITSATTTVTFSPGGITPNNSDGAFQPGVNQSGRPMASARYTYWNTDINRLTKTPYGTTWVVHMIGQISTGSLLNTEQLSVGGPNLLRGYDPYSILGDAGVVVSNELRSPTIGNPHGEGWLSKVGQTQFLGFWDYANLHNQNPEGNYASSLNASSVGAGVRYNLRSYAALRFDYGWQLRHLPNGIEGQGSRLANISLTLGN